MERTLGVCVWVCFLVCIGCSDDKGAGLGAFCEKDGDCSGALVCRNNICVEKPVECQPACEPQAETCVNGQCVPVGDPDDKDGDGSLAGDDCDDFNREVHPEAVEYCDGVDNDCDLSTDEDCPACADGQVQDCGTDVGECTKGTQACTAGQWAACAGVGVTIEICDGKDNDCDGLTDEVCPCTDGDQQPCGLDEGACVAGTDLCEEGQWSGCRGGDLPRAEICDGSDNDCDGTTDDGFMVGRPCDGLGECGTGTIECAGTTAVLCSTDPGGSADESQAESCDLFDNDCDGATDEGCPEGLDTCPESSHTQSELAGGPSADPPMWRVSKCNPGQVAIGIRGRAGIYIDAVGVICGIPSLDPDPRVTPPPERITFTPGDEVEQIESSSGGGAPYELFCTNTSSGRTFVAGMSVWYGTTGLPWLHMLLAHCADLNVNEASGTFLVERTEPDVRDQTGTAGAVHDPYAGAAPLCPDNQVLYGLEGYVGLYVNNLKLLCCDIELVLKQ